LELSQVQWLNGHAEEAVSSLMSGIRGLKDGSMQFADAACCRSRPRTAGQARAANNAFVIDFNGDGYPDVVAGNSLQATLPNGALGGPKS